MTAVILKMLGGASLESFAEEYAKRRFLKYENRVVFSEKNNFLKRKAKNLRNGIFAGCTENVKKILVKPIFREES